MSIAQKKDNEHSLHYLFPVFMRFLCLFCMMFHMFEGEPFEELFCFASDVRKVSGADTSTIFTWSMKITLSATAFANCISWVTMSMVFALFCQIQHNIQHFSYHLRIQCRGHFIEQQDLRMHAQCPDDGYTLLLSTGQLSGIILALSQSHARQKLHGLLLCLCLIALLYRPVPA